MSTNVEAHKNGNDAFACNREVSRADQWEQPPRHRVEGGGAAGARRVVGVGGGVRGVGGARRDVKRRPDGEVGPEAAAPKLDFHAPRQRGVPERVKNTL